ncbi:lipoyl(octanoyl) transferase LipB [Thiomicrospira sp. ALE5]|uniref:lipoyl(octanoyl) transferase LipB n=1 Tax=Thiomicrospira sp. ALE5 TaxID=748650 RepID=UPI0008F0C8FF|nr:lipoyl(octanoyl) transferase LipB [Thiomicrospira sp. ALE5]SFR53182.1 lipoyl(octanoyl) transferase [Thiomicrospira sp. ALE5]
MAAGLPIQIKPLGLIDYQACYQAMQDFTQARHEDTPDEIWLVQHPPVFTQGLNGDAKHLLDLMQGPAKIPLIQTDRGGQITYHGPGQWIVYPLLNLKRRQLGVKALVHLLEQTGINLLADYGITATARADAPGLYVAGQKIASLGLKVKRQCSYHGLALNVAMDLSPFQWITPCGLAGIQMTQVSNHVPDFDANHDSEQLGEALLSHLIAALHAHGASSL